MDFLFLVEMFCSIITHLFFFKVLHPPRNPWYHTPGLHGIVPKSSDRRDVLSAYNIRNEVNYAVQLRNAGLSLCPPATCSAYLQHKGFFLIAKSRVYEHLCRCKLNWSERSWTDLNREKVKHDINDSWNTEDVGLHRAPFSQLTCRVKWNISQIPWIHVMYSSVWNVKCDWANYQFSLGFLLLHAWRH